MKKSLLILIAMTIAVSAMAQVNVTINDPDIMIRFKRCIVVSNTAYLDFTVINNTGSDFQMHAYYCNSYNDEPSIAYDDEGNSYRADYKKGLTRCTLGSVTHEMAGLNGRQETIPNGIPLKGRLEISGVDNYATMFSLIKLQMWTSLNPGSRGYRTIEFKNVPIVRQ